MHGYSAELNRVRSVCDQIIVDLVLFLRDFEFVNKVRYEQRNEVTDVGTLRDAVFEVDQVSKYSSADGEHCARCFGFVGESLGYALEERG